MFLGFDRLDVSLHFAEGAERSLVVPWALVPKGSAFYSSSEHVSQVAFYSWWDSELPNTFQ